MLIRILQDTKYQQKVFIDFVYIINTVLICETLMKEVGGTIQYLIA